MGNRQAGMEKQQRPTLRSGPLPCVGDERAQGEAQGPRPKAYLTSLIWNVGLAAYRGSRGVIVT